MTTDIRVGDLVRATRKEDPEVVLQGRVKEANDFSVTVAYRVTHYDFWDYEVLDRPVPKVEDDLLEKVIEVHRKALNWGEYPLDDYNRKRYTETLTPVINAVRQYDKENSK